MVRRRYQRVPLKRTINLRVLRPASDMHTGMTNDFSPDGCAVRHGTSGLHCGMRVKVWLALPDRAECLEINHAAVTWTTERQCGIRFMAVIPEDHARIKTVYDLLLQAQTEEEESAKPIVITLCVA